MSEFVRLKFEEEVKQAKSAEEMKETEEEQQPKTKETPKKGTNGVVLEEEARYN